MSIWSLNASSLVERLFTSFHIRLSVLCWLDYFWCQTCLQAVRAASQVFLLSLGASRAWLHSMLLSNKSHKSNSISVLELPYFSMSASWHRTAARIGSQLGNFAWLKSSGEMTNLDWKWQIRIWLMVQVLVKDVALRSQISLLERLATQKMRSVQRNTSIKARGQMRGTRS